MLRDIDFFSDSTNYGYNRTYWTSDSREIRQVCYEFEERFRFLENNYFQIRKLFNVENYEEYIRLVTYSRIQKYLNR